MTSQRIGILTGGSTTGRETSLQNGRAVAHLLESAGYDVVRLELAGRRDPAEQIRKAAIDTAFVSLKGGLGENGCIQGLLEILGIPYTGSGVLESALARDKLKSKELFRLHNVPTPAYYLYSGAADAVAIRAMHRSFGFPVFVMPRHSGVTSCCARDEESMCAAIGAALIHDPEVVVERCVRGTEVLVGLLNRRVLGALERPCESEPCGRLGPRTTGALSEPLHRNVLNLAERAADALGLSGAVQVTLILTEDQNEYVVDIDPSPSLMSGSIYTQIAEAAGYAPLELYKAILGSAKLHLSSRTSSRAAVLPIVKAEERAVRALAG